MFPKSPSKPRTFLVLGRVSNLPTVWSNCLAGWWLSGGGQWLTFVCLCVAASLLYAGGMFLNDAFDVEFDQQHGIPRPIPSGAIKANEVWLWGIGFMVVGGCWLAAMGKTTAIFTVLLIGCIVFYNAIHKVISISPVLMALCRTLLYLVAASVASDGVNGAAVWGGIVMGLYVVGLTYLSRKERPRTPVRYWPLALLASPVILAMLVNDGSFRVPGLILGLVVCAWITWSLRALWPPERNIGIAVSRLLAGIVLVDFLAVTILLHPVALWFAFWFVLALFLQRYIPAT